MRSTMMRAVITAISIAVLGLSESQAAPEPSARPPIRMTPAASGTRPSTAPDNLVARGEYLAHAAHCNACHTREGGQPFAGNLAIHSSFGTMYSSNITPDIATGIGNWTEKEFEGALRRGVGKDGEYLYPAMPYLEFTKISDEDVHALWVYFRSVKPVAERTKLNDMKFPFNIRLGIAGWQALYLRQGRYVADPSQSAQWNRGAYLVQGLGHCDACHTPTNIAMAPKTDKALQGNVVDHWFAPDISGGRYSKVKGWDETELARFLKTGHDPKDNRAVVGPMQTSIDLGLSQLRDDDLAAIANYLKNQAAVDEAAPKTAGGLRSDEERRVRASGQALYTANCVTCHGPDGRGMDGIAPALAGAGSLTGKSSQTAVRAVVEGFPPQDRWGAMPSFGRVLSAQEIANVVDYTRTAWGNTGTERVTARLVNHVAFDSDVASPRVESALVCSTASTADLDPTTLAQIRDIPTDRTATDTAAQRVVREFRTRHPRVSKSELVTSIAGAYCRNVMSAAKGTLAERQQRYVEFMGSVAKAAVGG